MVQFGCTFVTPLCVLSEGQSAQAGEGETQDSDREGEADDQAGTQSPCHSQSQRVGRMLRLT